MWTRRETVVGGAAALLLGSTGRSLASERHNPIYGCTLPDRETALFFDTATESRLYITGDEPLIEKSGDHDFDYALAHTLAKISQTFDVAPGFAYYDDYDGKNAYATKHIRSYGVDGTVLVGQRLLDRLRSGNDHPDVAVACVCAHEFGHILQYKLQLNDKVSDGQKTVKPVELQADFFAGYFAGIRKLERPTFPAAVFAMTQFNMGDEMVHNPQHHGTPDERANAIVRGFDVAYREQEPLSAAVDISTEYVKAL
jgi:hypothetical protein